MGWCACRDILE
jgi:hypothetical protein